MPLRPTAWLMPILALFAASLTAADQMYQPPPASDPAPQPAAQPYQPQSPEPPPPPRPAPVLEEQPDLLVTIEKRPANPQAVPRSATVFGPQQLKDADVRTVRDAATGVPNLLLQEFTARKLSFPYIRGIGSGPQNPSVTTTIDGVPQIHANSASIELSDLDRVEFVRGSQSALYGRNTLGGVVNIHTAPPDLNHASARAEATFGSANLNDLRLTANAPVLADKLAFRFTGGHIARDGFTKNLFTQNDLDTREALFGRASMLWKLASEWQARLSIAGEHARDGDYALGDLNALRTRPHRVNHDYEGFTNRDLIGPTLTIQNRNQAVQVTSTTGMLWWRTEDRTDLDTTPTDLLVRSNTESMTQWTQEFLFASTFRLAGKPIFDWQAGLFFFSSDYGQDVVNHFSAAAAAGLGVPFPFDDISRSELNDSGTSLFGNATLPIGVTGETSMDITLGLRYDRESKRAHLNTASNPAIAAPTSQSFAKTFGEVSPHAAVAFYANTHVMAYLDFATGFKAGGFNTNAPAGGDQYDPEHSSTLELGAKTDWLDRRLTANASVFYIHWSDLQLDVPNISVPGRFFVDNVGEAISRGFEIELAAHPAKPWDLFFGAGYLDAKFLAGSMASGTAVGGHFLPYAPSATGRMGFQYTAQIEADFAVFFRAEATYTGRYFYDASNNAKQSPYGLINLRTGFRTPNWSMSAYAKNLFNAETVPLAFPYQAAFAPSGYVGESGAPATFGATLEIGL